MSRISIKAIVIGGPVDVVSSLVVAIPIAVIAVSHGVNLNLTHKWRPVERIVGFTCSVLGGYVAGKLAKQNQSLNGILSSWLCTLLGICSLAFGSLHQSAWLEGFNFIAAPVCALLGGYLARPRTNPEFA